MKNIFFAIILIFAYPAFSQQSISLIDAQKLAIESNVKLKNSQLETQAALEVKASAKTNYYPSVSLDILAMHAIDPLMEIKSEGGNLPVYDGNPANLQTATEFAYIPASTTGLLQKMGVASIAVTQPIYTGGKIRMGNELADMGVDARKKQETLSEKEILLETTEQYWQIVSLQEKQKTIEKYEELLSQLDLQVNDAYKAGLIIRNDVYRLDLEQNELELNKNRLANGKQLALMQFCNTTGIPFDSTLFLTDDIDDFQKPLAYRNNDILGFLNNLTEVQLLEKSIDIQQLQTKLKEADYLPTVAVGLNAFYLSEFEKNTNSVNALGFVSVSIPISSQWSGKHDVKELEIKQKMTQNTLENTKQLLQLRAEKSWIDLLEYYNQIEIIEDRILAANENLKVNQTSYESGVVPLSDLLEAKALQTEALDYMIEAKTKYRVAITTYLQHTGN